MPDAALREPLPQVVVVAALVGMELAGTAATRASTEPERRCALHERDQGLAFVDVGAGWIKKSQPLCLIGVSGTGKSHMLIVMGTEAAMKGYRVRCALATKLVNGLAEAADEKQLDKAIACYGRVDQLCIDELGSMELDRRGAELLFQVLTEREEKNSVAIVSNESFGGWTKTFTDPRLCPAIVDRLTFNGTIIETGTDSYRLAGARARAEEPAEAG
ncbi:ATP-binding protein [Streptomyces sp. NPDC059218]|uniref:ATP-binding protein n=1 Tax=unclassified Streptomyces TaxID=2593676 RepID=UPI003676D238